MTTTVSGSTALSPRRDLRIDPADHTDDPDTRPRVEPLGVVQQPVAGSGADVFADILSEAWRPGAAEPVAIHVHPKVQARLVPHPCSTPAAGCRTRCPARPGTRIPVIVDDRIPTAPGYEVHRAPPPSGDRPDL